MVRVPRVLIEVLILWLLILRAFVLGILVPKVLVLAVFVLWVLGFDILVLRVLAPGVFVLGVLLLEVLSQNHWQDQR